MTDRMIKACPRCDSCNIYWRSWKKNYRCSNCHAEFEKPVERESRRWSDYREPTTLAERRERYCAKEAVRKAKEAENRVHRQTARATSWQRKYDAAKARWHEKFGDMPSQNIP